MNIQVIMPAGEICDRFLPAENCGLLEGLGQVTWNPGPNHYTEDELRAILPAADVVVSGWGCPCISGELLGEARPRLLAHTGGTVAPFVDAETFARGMRVVCANEVYAKSVAEGVVAYMLAGLRRIPFWDGEVRKGKWRGDDFINFGLFGKRVGLTGYGAITRYLLPLLRAFECEVLLCSGHLEEAECNALGVRKASLEEIFSTCDVVSLHNALTEKTIHMVDERLLSMLKENALLVNTARGKIVDEAALAKALATNRFFAVLDVI